MKFCTQCKYSQEHPWEYLCLKNAPVSMVTGMPQPPTCKSLRSDHGACGPEGRWFEEKPEDVGWLMCGLSALLVCYSWWRGKK